MSQDYKVCLTAVGKPRHIVSLKPEDTIADVRNMAQDHYGCSVQELKAGFPPKTLQDEVVMARTVLAPNERVQVIICNSGSDKAAAADAKKTATKPKATTTDASATLSRRSQRSAAKAASDSFKDVIQAQEQLMKQETTKKKSTSKKRSRPTTNNNNNLAAQRRMARMPGRRLANGDSVGPSSQRPRKTQQSLKDKDDVSFALLNALNGGGGGGKVGQVLRASMRNAVHSRYEATRAQARVTAVQSGKYTLEQHSNDSLKVQFDKGMEGRGNFEETVDWIPRDALVAVIQAIYKDEMELLRPVQLAQLSPRVFWSVVHHASSFVFANIQEALQQVVPELDMAQIEKRKPMLSEKAKENLRQEQGDAEQDDLEAAHEAVEAVEHAMEQLQDYDQNRMRERAANAALARLQPTATATQEQQPQWSSVTPNELDREELQECIGENDNVQAWIDALVEAGICNWRLLANANPEQIATLCNVQQDVVLPWLDHAQQESVEEIMCEICDSNGEAVACLRDEAKSGTPRDLASWRQIPDMLYNSAPSLDSCCGVSPSQLATWCLRAHEVLQSLEWLEWYATPVDAS